jgi:aminotransferase
MSYVSQRIRAIPPSGLESFFDLLAGMDDVLSLGIGEPDVPSPTAVRRAGMASIDRGDTGYTSNAGIAALRERIAADLAARYGVHYDPGSEILVTVGVSEALHIAMLALVDPGDEVLIPEPCFVSYDPCVRLADGVTHWVPTRAEDDFAVRVPALEAAAGERSRVLLLSYPNNPTGAVMTREEMLAVARFAAERDLIVISDEIYDRFVYGIEHTCVAALPGMRERTLLMGGFSKSHAMTGWRLGYVCGPAELIRALNRAHQYIIMSAPTPAQLAALAAYDDGEEDIARNVAEFARRRDVLVPALAEIGLPCSEPRGAIYAFPSIAHTGLTALEFSERLLLQEKVAVVPGDAFGPSGAGHVRMAYTVPLPVLEEVLERIQRFVQGL